MHAASASSLPPVRERVSEAEWNRRIELAACYRLIARFGWDDLIYTHISARVPGEDGTYLINPFGLYFDEITASSLVKVDLDCNVVSDTPYEVNPAGFIVHGAVHRARHDAECVIHLHTDAGVGVSAQQQGLLPLSQSALFFYGDIGYHDYEGIAVAEGEIERLGRDLGNHRAMLLRNHGTLSVGASVAQAFIVAYFLERACAQQVAALAGGSAVVIPPEPVQQIVRRQAMAAFGMAGTLEWAGLIRRLDREDPSYRT